MDVTPHLVTGAALAVRVKRPGAAIVCAIASHFVLDAIPHFHIAWGDGVVRFEAIDVGLGLLLTGVIALSARRVWPFVGAIAAVLPDMPGLREHWEVPMSYILPHPTWDPPWGIVTQIVVASVALLWGIGTGWKHVLSPRRWVRKSSRVDGAWPAPSPSPPVLSAFSTRPRHDRVGRR